MIHIGYLADGLPDRFSHLSAAAVGFPTTPARRGDPFHSGPRMGMTIDVEQPSRVDRGVDLR
jgi:hypothetical protein